MWHLIYCYEDILHYVSQDKLLGFMIVLLFGGKQFF